MMHRPCFLWAGAKASFFCQKHKRLKEHAEIRPLCRTHTSIYEANRMEYLTNAQQQAVEQLSKPEIVSSAVKLPSDLSFTIIVLGKDKVGLGDAS